MMDNRNRSDATIVVDSTPKYDYLSKYKYNALVASAYGKTNVFIGSPQNLGRSQTIKISGAAEHVKKTKEKVYDIVNGVKTSRFVVGLGTGTRDVTVAVELVAHRTECIVHVEHISSLDLSPDDIMPMVLKCNGMKATTVTTLFAELQLQKADVIVNTTHKNLTMGAGGLSAALLQVCGACVQEELRQEYPDGVEHGEVAETGPGELATCQAIYHGALPFWKGLDAVSMDKCYIALVSVVYRCLIKASSAGYQSLAFPALGTGKLEYPDIDVVKLMFRAVSMFLEENPATSLQDIYFIVYPGASLELKQYFLVYSVTQKVSSEQLNNTATLHAKLRVSHSERFEVMFRVGKTLVKVVNADVNEACHPSCPVLILWSPEEIQDPSLNNSVKCLCTRSSNNDQFQLVVANLAESRAVSDTTSITSRTLLHCYCGGDSDNDITTAIQHGLEQAHKHCCPSVVIPIPSEDRLSDRPISTCEAVLKAVKKCSSSVCAIAVVIPDAKVFVPFVSKAAKMYKPVEAAELDTKTLVENTWFDSLAEWSRFKSVETLKKGDFSVLTVTSDSEETNKRVAMDIQQSLLDHASVF